MGDVSSSSFEFYEGLRALVPGGFVVGLYAAVSTTFGFGSAIGVDSTLVAFLATLAAGFVLLFLDIPGRAAVSHYNTPVEHLANWTDLRPRANASYKNVYYEILDVEVPAGIKTKVYYFGAIYKIGFEMIYIAAASVPILAVVDLFPSTGVTRHAEPGEMRGLFITALVLHVVIASLALYGRRRKIRSDFAEETPARDRALLGAGAIALMVHLVSGWRWWGLAAVAIPWALWAFRYYGGVPAPDSPNRRNLHASTAAVRYAIAAISVCAVGIRSVEDASALDAGLVAGWAGASLIAASLVAARDHEKKLLGVYATQRTWLDGKRDALVAKGYFVPNSQVQPSP